MHPDIRASNVLERSPQFGRETKNSLLQVEKNKNNNKLNLMQEKSYCSSKKYSATGGTGGYINYTESSPGISVGTVGVGRNQKNSSKVLGDY